MSPSTSFDHRIRTIAGAIAFGVTALEYSRLRQQHPLVPARLVKLFIDEAPPLLFPQFVCEQTTGHSWSHTGTAYGGDDDSYHGEGRCYCLHCGADGVA